MENKAHALAAGIFVLVVTALVVGLATWLARDISGGSVYEIVSTQAVTGLKPQAAVRYRGVSVGKVESIGFNNDVRGQVLVRINVDEGTPITTSTFATLGFQGVTGLSYVELDDRGSVSALLAGVDGRPPRIPLRASLLSRVSDQGAELLTEAEESAKRFNQLLSPERQKTFFASVEQIGQAAQGLTRLSESLDAAVKQLRPALASAPALTQNLQQTLQSLQGTSGEVAKAANATSQAAAEFGKTAVEFNKTAQRLSAPGGALDKLGEGGVALTQSAQQINSSTLPRASRALDDSARAARQLSRTAKDLNENPQSLIYGSGAAAPGPGENGFVPPKSAAQGTP
jgi:phospholipid/cholesterol/gamma-HCH transport system substrate-binding protein